MPVIVDSDRMRGREARNSTVEGHEAGTGKGAPGNEQAPTAPPEATQEQKSGKEQKPTESTPSWTAEERAKAIEAERERQAQRDRSNDNDPGREFEP